MQKALVSQSDGPPSLRLAPFAARSDSVVIPSSSDFALVITKALVSTASLGSAMAMSFASSNGVTPLTFLSTSVPAGLSGLDR